MKRVFIFLTLICTILSASATEYSEFASKQYEYKCDAKNLHITVKREHVEEYAQEIGNKFIPYIAYGYGDLKGKNCKKKRVSYICLLDSDLKPLWSYVIPR